MYKIEKSNIIDEQQLRSFLKFVKYPKFNLYPGVNNLNIQNYLYDLINSSCKDDTVFVYTEDTEIIALVIVKFLDWDSKHFGINCASISNIFVNDHADYRLVEQALSKLLCEIQNHAILEKIRFMSVSINSMENIISAALQSNNFKYILTWVDGIYNSKERMQSNEDEFKVGVIEKSEIEHYKKIASKYYFKGGRFYLDKNFNASLVDSMYSNLITSSYENNDIMLSCRYNGKPLGLFVCKKIVEYPSFNNLLVAPLRYLIVEPEARNKHVGNELFASTINYLLDKCNVISTGLEVHNLPSLNLHLKLNFKINHTHNVFHWWGPTS